MKPLTFYGKKSCVTCKKAAAYLDEAGVPYEYLEIEKTPPPESLLDQAVDAANVKASLNSRSAIYKEKGLGQSLPDKATALRLMQQDPNLIKRPLIVNEQGALYQGFEADTLGAYLKS